MDTARFELATAPVLHNTANGTVENWATAQRVAAGSAQPD